ncbi:MAG: hypothetical protein ACYDCL_10030 [Myxococcales bacterium]
MTREIEELPADVKALLAVERAPLPMPPEVHDRLARRVATISVGVAALSGLASFGERLAHFLGRRASVALLSFGLGSGAGAEIHAAVARYRAVRHASAATVPVPVPAPEAPRPVVETLAPALRARAPAVQPPSSSTLAAERTVLEMARTALTRGDAAGALAAVGTHAEGFPRGELVEERESLRVQALLALGRRGEARVALRQLEAKYPKSLGLSALKEQVEVAPQ